MQEFSEREWNDFAPRVLPEAQVGAVLMGAPEIQLAYYLSALPMREFSQRERGGFALRDDSGYLVEGP